MRLSLSDGYTLEFATEETVTDVAGRPLPGKLPVVKGRYRPALPEAIAEWRYKFNRATSGKEEVAATAAHLAAHLTEWDVVLDGEKPAPLEADFIRLVPDPVLSQLVNVVNTWAPRQKAADAGN